MQLRPLNKLKRLLIVSLLCITLGLGLSSCGFKPVIPDDEFTKTQVEQIELKKFNLRIDKMQKYLETVHKLSEPKPIILKKNGEVYIRVDGEPAQDEEVIAYAVEEHNKIVAKIQQENMMAEIAQALVDLHNIKIEMYNSMIDYVKLQQEMTMHYRRLYIEENIRRQYAEYELKMEKYSNKATLGATILGIAAIFILAL